jgi:hypothetical protein
LEQGRIVSRRSFLAQVMGGALAGAAVLSPPPALARRRRRRMVVDADPRDPARLPSAQPRPDPPQPLPPPTLPDSGPTISGGVPPRRVQRNGPSAPSRFVICPGNRRCPGRNR